MEKQHLGYQKTIDFYACDAQSIDDCAYIERTLLEAARIMNLTVVNATIHEFMPIGVSGVIVIEESHIAIHTWPEHEYVAIDIFMCSPYNTLAAGIAFLKDAFKASRVETKEILRGSLREIKKTNILRNEN